MTARPTSITVFALYLLIVFSISAVGSLYGAIMALPPYSTLAWLVLAIPKMAALAAGLAFWKMLRVGAWFWAASVVLGWVMAFNMGAGFFPTLSAALAVTTLIVAMSIWVIYINWDKLLTLSAARRTEGTDNA